MIKYIITMILAALTLMANPKGNSMENLTEIYLGGGCFWGTQGYFDLINGVVYSEVGYANGKQLHKRLIMFQITKEQFIQALMVINQEETNA